MSDYDVYIDLPKSNGEIEILVKNESGEYVHTITHLTHKDGSPIDKISDARDARKRYIKELEEGGNKVKGVRSITDKLKSKLDMVEVDEVVAFDDKRSEPVIETAPIENEVESTSEDSSAVEEPIETEVVRRKKVDLPEGAERVRSGAELARTIRRVGRVWYNGRLYKGLEIRSYWNKLLRATINGEVYKV